MKQKLFTILTLLLCLCSTAWGQSAITITWPMVDNNNVTSQAGSASVSDIVTVNNATLSTAYTSLAWGDSKNLSYSDGEAGANGNYKFYAGGVTVTNNPNSDNNNASVNEDCYLKFTFTVAGDKTFTPTGFSFDCGRSGTDAGCVQGALILADGSTKSTSTIVRPTRSDKKNVYDSHVSKTITGAVAFAAGSTVTFYIYIGGKCGGKTLYFRDVTITGTYASSSMTQLSAPSISVNQLTGQVIFNDIDANATKVTYTTDGTEPTASSTAYSEPFAVNENCTIKAIAIGDGETYINSSVASKEAIITVDNPTIKAYNGTVQITCSTDGATIKYNFDGGETWNSYTYPFTLLEGKTVYAKAESASFKNNSAIVNQAVAAAPAATTGSQTKILGFVTPGENNWEYMSGDNGNGGTTNYGIQGKADTEEEGWSLWISPNGSEKYDKPISGDASENSTYTISGNDYQYIKNSNGRQFNIGIPSNIRANRITIYSWNNVDGTTIWSTVGGSNYTTANEISIVSNSGSTPETRVFALDNVADNIVLNNAGVQQCFIAVVDYTKYVPGPADPNIDYVGSTWDFSAITAADETLLQGNTDAWTYDSTNKLYKNASQWNQNTDHALEGSNGTDISIADGLLFGRTSGNVSPNGFVLDVNNHCFYYTGNSGNYVKLPSLGIGTKVSIDWEASGGSRTLTPTNATVADGYTNSASSGTKLTTVFNVTSTDPVIISFNGKAFVYSMSTTSTEIASINLTTSDNMAGWRAFYGDGQGYTLDANTKAYIVTSAPSNNSVSLVKLASEGEDIPGNTPVILCTSSSANSYKMTLTKKTVANYTGDNLLKVTTAGSAYNVYRLGYGASGKGFYPYSTASAPANVIYLDAEPNSARGLSIVFDGETTGINTIENSEFGIENSDAPMYNLAGQRVTKSYKGVVIVNGKKMLNK